MALASYLRAQLDQLRRHRPAAASARTTTASAASASASAGDDRAADDGGRHDDPETTRRPRPSRPRRRPDGQGSRYSPPGSRTARPSATTPAATRAARASSSGQPMVAPRWVALDRTPSEGADQATPALAVGADEGRLRPAGVRRPRRGIRRRASGRRPRARPRPRAGPALRSAGPADGGAEVEQGLVPGPALALRHGRVGQRLDLAGPQRAARPAGPGPGDVGVDDGHVGLEGEGHDRPGRVRPDARAGAAAPAIVRGSAPPKSRSTAPAAACSRTARPL